MVTETAQDFLCMQVGGARLALALAHVIGISEPVPATPLPFAPPMTEGLALVMGRIVPVLPLGAVVGVPGQDEQGQGEQEHCEGGSLVLAIHGEDARALRVETADFLARIEAWALRPELAGPGPFAAAFDHAGEVWRVLDLPALFAGATMPAQLAEDPGPAPIALADAPRLEPAPTGGTGEAFMVLRVGGEDYAVPTASLSELIEAAPPRPMPGAAEWVAGLLDLRGMPVVALSLSRLLGHAATAPLHAPLGVVLREGGGRVVLLADVAVGIERYDTDAVHPMPEAMAGVSAYAVTAQGRIVGILSPDALLAQVTDVLEALTPATPAAVPETVVAPAAGVQRILVARAGGEGFAVPLDRVVRIEVAVRATPLPRTGLGFDAMVDAGDRPIPVIDIRQRLGMAPCDENPPPCILVMLEGALAGLVVDQVVRIEDVPAAAMDGVAPDGALPLSGIARIAEGMVPVLALERLLPPM